MGGLSTAVGSCKERRVGAMPLLPPFGSFGVNDDALVLFRVGGFHAETKLLAEG